MSQKREVVQKGETEKEKVSQKRLTIKQLHLHPLLFTIKELNLLQTGDNKYTQSKIVHFYLQKKKKAQNVRLDHEKNNNRTS